jgi:uncharacterized protein involved in type VI secretion and phage assembly
MFAAGDPRHPVIMGSVWNGQDAAPEQMDGNGDNNIKSIVSRRDIRLTFDDTSGQETLTIETPRQRITLSDGGPSIEITDGSGNSIRLESSGITVNSASKVTIKGTSVEVTAGSVTVNAAMSRFNGVVQADTVMTNAVISASYTPGAGNVW